MILNRVDQVLSHILFGLDWVGFVINDPNKFLGQMEINITMLQLFYA